MVRSFIKILFPLWLICSWACQPKKTIKKEYILGAWKADSVYHFTNGFVQAIKIEDSEENIVYDYDTTGTVFMRKDGEQRSMKYQIIENDSLVYFDNGGRYLAGFTIVLLEPEKLVLKKIQKPLFAGKNQEIYDIRCFSHINR
ncbi:hypothetical protein [Flectobacillus major]|uniref:hypothetical protein n=1 Tax=Flectobacillus major TaxID=103 RepID=UPI00047AAE92|nr:hypothetical protein [Flectobacillus major]